MFGDQNSVGLQGSSTLNLFAYVQVQRMSAVTRRRTIDDEGLLEGGEAHATGGQLALAQEVKEGGAPGRHQPQRAQRRPRDNRQPPLGFLRPHLTHCAHIVCVHLQQCFALPGLVFHHITYGIMYA